MSDDLKAVWAATYGAAFARQVLDHMRDGYGGPDQETCEVFAAEASAVAEMACEMLDPELGLRYKP